MQCVGSLLNVAIDEGEPASTSGGDQIDHALHIWDVPGMQ